MSVSIKLSRFGAKKAPFYRIVAQTTRSKRDGKSHAIIGWWNPKTDEKEIDKQKLNEWIGKGAILTNAVKNLVEGKKPTKKTKKKNKKEESSQ